MRPRGVSVALILHLTICLILQVSGAEDLYLEGEEDASNEFLEVKDEGFGLAGHLNRIKRQFNWDFFSPFSSSSTTTTEAPPAFEIATDDPDADGDGPDNEDLDHGSGLPDRGVEDLGEKTLRVTFVVMEPYQTEYSNRDSEQFQNFSRTIADAVNMLYETLPGTQKASLVRIQSRISDEFSCKVTLDIVTTGYDDLERISKILQDHIRNRQELGVSHSSVKVSDADFSANPIDPGLGSGYTCGVDELRCNDNACVPGNARCNGIHECADGSDEIGCLVDENVGQESVDQVTVPAEDCERIACSSSAVTICADQRCNGFEECPNGDDEEGCEADVTTTQTAAPPVVTTEASRPDDNEPINCPEGEFACDETRCVSFSRRCDNNRDCYDGTDEQGCDIEISPAEDRRE